MQRNHNTPTRTGITRFTLGQTFITPRAEEAIQIAGQTEIEFLRRHMSGDWGDLSDDDIAENEISLNEGFRLLSSYQTAKGQQLWIITEADRSATTILRLLNTNEEKRKQAGAYHVRACKQLQRVEQSYNHGSGCRARNSFRASRNSADRFDG